jgi:type IV secretory pathway VirB10-like protein
MRLQRNIFLAGFAALALVAGIGFAAAQESKDQNGAQAKQPQAATQQMNKRPAAKMGQMNRSPASGKMAQGAQNKNSGPNAPKLNKQAQEKNYGNKSAKFNAGNKHIAQTQREKQSAMARHEGTKARTTAAAQNRFGRQNTAQRQPNGMQNTAERQRHGLQGLQGNAAGMHVQLSDEQRMQIRNSVLNAPGAPRANNVNFNVAVGTVIPRGTVNVVAVPETLVRIHPAWRGFRYFVWMNDVVIVNPRDMTIVAVVYA